MSSHKSDHLAYREGLQEYPKSILSTALKIILPLLIVGAGISAFGFVTGVFGGAAETAKNTYGAKAAVYKYEWFKDKSNNIKSYDVQYTTATNAVATFKKDAGPRKGWTFEDKQEYSRLQSVAQGLRNQRNSVASEYNAASEKATWSVFQTNDLPRSIQLLP